MTIHTTSFRNLDNVALYDILRLRSEVFVVEQNCVYQDLDDIDKKAKRFYLEAQTYAIPFYERLGFKVSPISTDICK